MQNVQSQVCNKEQDIEIENSECRLGWFAAYLVAYDNRIRGLTIALTSFGFR